MFFFKQKTAYEMRISDWSSDVCSSDLGWTAACGKQRDIPSGKVEMFDIAALENAPCIAEFHFGAGRTRAGNCCHLVARERAFRQDLHHLAPDISGRADNRHPITHRSEEHTSELQSLMRISSAVFRLKK